MARRRNGRQKDPLDYISFPKVNLDPDIKKGIFIVFILALGAICLLSLFGLAGAIGIYLAKGMFYLFGWGKWIFPFILLVFGFILYHEEKDWARGGNYLGLFLFVLSFQALLHMFVAFTPDPGAVKTGLEAVNVFDKQFWGESVKMGIGGGYIGLFLSSALIKILGIWGGLIAIVGLFLVSLMLFFNTTLDRIVGHESRLAKLLYHPLKFIFAKFFKRKEKELSYEENGGITETEEEALAEAEAAFEDLNQTAMDVPLELVPIVRKLIAKHQG
jgi:hypothetical protein